MSPDPRWLEILKASAWQTFAIATGTGVFLYLARQRILPPVPDGALLVAWITFLICTMLFLTSFISACLKFFTIRSRFVAFWRERAERKDLIEYIPHMRPVERQILGYLLANNQQMFEGDIDGGHASTLISRGIIVRALQPGQAFRQTKVPYVIQNHHWEILQRPVYKEQFTAKVDSDAPHPWRENWMER
jgi:hypothetical protein